ncbi:hypothetical protein R1flu_013071 [Riccia fluitans]|uniref:Uncharacterized protein n=1 Tax=Riccia fluitans TaxID=41844 RepID=A0ABD1ZEW3_9MARC
MNYEEIFTQVLQEDANGLGQVQEQRAAPINAMTLMQQCLLAYNERLQRGHIGTAGAGTLNQPLTKAERELA